MVIGVGVCSVINDYPVLFSPFLYSSALPIFQMFLVSRRFFTTGAVAEKAATEVSAQLRKEFAERCAAMMKVHGHHKLEMDTVKSKNGHTLRLDFSYGWPFRYYCMVNTSEEMVTKEEMMKFEVVVLGTYDTRAN